MSNEELHVLPMEAWIEQISKMDINSLTKMKNYIADEMMQRKLKTLSYAELGKLLSKCKSLIATMSVDDTVIEIGDDVV